MPKSFEQAVNTKEHTIAGRDARIVHLIVTGHT